MAEPKITGQPAWRALTTAKALVEKAQGLLDGANSEDREDLIDLIESGQAASESLDPVADEDLSIRCTNVGPHALTAVVAVSQVGVVTDGERADRDTGPPDDGFQFRISTKQLFQYTREVLFQGRSLSAEELVAEACGLVLEVLSQFSHLARLLDRGFPLLASTEFQVGVSELLAQ